MLKRLLSIFILLIFVKTSFSQSNTQSPYSYYGLGETQYQGSAAQIGMAGLSYSYHDSNSINVNNPASFSALRLTVFDMAIRGEFNVFKTSTSRATLNNGNLSYLTFGFPILYKRWGTSVGLLPFTSTGYNLKTFGKTTDNVLYTNSYTGTGGVNRVFWGNGVAINRNLSLGLNLSYFFGTITKGRNTEFSKSGYYNSSSYVQTHYNNLGFNLGVLYKTDSLFYVKKDYFQRYILIDSITTDGDTIKINKDVLAGLSKRAQKNLKAYKWLRLNFGFTGNIAQNVDVTTDIYNNTYKYNNAGIAIQRDTLFVTSNATQTVKMPLFLAGGISLQDVNRWLVGVDGNFQQWSTFSDQTTDTLTNAFKVSLGGEYTPKYNSPSYWERVTYRVGTRYTHTQINLQNNPINEYAFTFGFAFPIRKDAVTAAYSVYQTKLNLAFEIGTRGTTADNLLKENYFRLTLGVNFNELWFVKRKFE